MKQPILFFILTSLITILSAHFSILDVQANSCGNITWQKTSGPTGGIIMALAVDPTSPRIIYAGALSGGIFISSDSGETWNHTGLTSKSVQAIVINPSNLHVYAGTSNGVFKSTDGGKSWDAASTGMTNTYVTSLVIDPTTQILYVGTYNGGVFKSDNGGASWSDLNTGLTNTYVQSLAIDPATPAFPQTTIYAGTVYGGVFKYTDGGTQWNELSTGLPPYTWVTSIAIAPSDHRIYAGTWGNGIYESVNGDGNWSAVNGLSSSIVLSLAIDPVAPQTIYAGIYGDSVYKSENGGVNWSNTGLSTTYVNSLAIVTTIPSTIYAGTGEGIFIYNSSGKSWNATNAGLIATGVFSLAADPNDPLTVYSGTNEGVFKTSDGGTNWIAVNNGLQTPDESNINAIVAIAPTTPPTIYTGTGGWGIFKWDYLTGSWGAINNGLENTNIKTLAIAPSNPQVLYVGTYGGIFKSIDGGTNWSAVNNGLSTTWVYSLAIDPTDPQIVYAGTYGGGLFKSFNGGGDWSAVTGLAATEIHAIAIDPITPQTVYAGGLDVFKSEDGGKSWNTINTGRIFTYVTSLVIDPLNPKNIYAGTFYAGVFTSVDGGTNWNSLNTGLPANIFTSSLALAPSTPLTIYSGTLASGVFKAQPESFSTVLTVHGSGYVTSEPADISCGATCSAKFVCGTSVTLTATPDSGSTFAGWSGACTGTSAGICTVTVDQATNVTASFVSIPVPEINTVVAGGSGTITPAITGATSSYSATLTITPAVGHYLATLTDNGIDVTTSVNGNIYTIGNLTTAHTVVATFAANGPDLAITIIRVTPSKINANGARVNIPLKVKNQGASAAGPFNVGLYLSTDSTITTSDQYLGQALVTAPAIGEQKTVPFSVTIPALVAGGSYYIGAIADIANIIIESDETNNSTAGSRATVANTKRDKSL